MKHPPIWPISTPDAPCDNLSGYLAKKQNLSPLRPCYLLQSSLNTFNDRLILIISRVATPLLYTTESQYVNINLNPCFSVLFLSYISNITFLFNLNLNIKNLKNNWKKYNSFYCILDYLLLTIILPINYPILTATPPHENTLAAWRKRLIIPCFSHCVKELKAQFPWHFPVSTKGHCYDSAPLS